MKRSSILAILILVGLQGYCQNDIPLSEYLSKIERQSANRFFYKREWLDSIRVAPAGDEGQFLEVIRKAVNSSGLKVYSHLDHFFFIYPNRIEFERSLLLASSENTFEPDDLKRIGHPTEYDELESLKLSGNVSDEEGTKLAGANILLNGVLKGRTDEEGRYSIDNLFPGNYELNFSYVGLEPESEFVTIYSSGQLNVALFKESTILDEVVVESFLNSEEQNIASVGVQKINVSKLEKLPSLSGDLDIVKGAAALPGVSVSGESSSYLNIRGGGNDQTLMLMNNSTVYNPGHLLGFFSVYNGDFVSDLTIYKGNIPPRYGVRSSSVVDVKMNKWAKDELNVYGGIGIMNSNLGIKKNFLDDRLKIHIGGRLSYVDWVLGLIPDEDILNSSVNFGDLNTGAFYRLNDLNSIQYHGYYGSDYFKYSDRAIYNWESVNNSLKWTKLFKNDALLEVELASSVLSNSTESLIINDEFKFNNGVKEISVKGILSNDEWETGIEVTRYDISLGDINPTTENSFVTTANLEAEDAVNVGAFVGYNWSLFNNLKINPGIRVNNFLNLGPESVNIYAGNANFIQGNVTSVDQFSNNQVIKSRILFEPRLGLNYQINQGTFRGGYSRINQLVHLISNTILVNPSTTWKASDAYIPPTKIDQFSLGYEHSFEGIGTIFSVDAYFKNLSNLIDYRNGAELVLNDDLEQAIVLGDGNSYGLEFLVAKKAGIFSGLVSYSYSRSFIRIEDQRQGVVINDGERYPYYSDRPHNLRANLDWKITEKWTLSSNFTYTSGAPISSPISTFTIEGVSIPLFSDRNASRIPDYHRLDLVLTLKSRIRKTKKNNDRWVLTLYNVYGRSNIATIFFASQDDVPNQAFQLINVGRMIPSLTYKFEF